MHTDKTSDRGDPGHQGKGQAPVTIIVNAREKQVATKELTFREVVQLAFDDAVFNETTVYTVTFKRGQGEKPEGTLVDGDTLKVKEGMVINVTRTDRS